MRKTVSIMVVLVMLFTSVVYAGSWYPGAQDYFTEELDRAVENGIDRNFSDYSANITRAQFADVIMAFYYEMMGKYPEMKSNAATFTDSTHTNVLLAYDAGIIKGKGNAIFAPNDPITRQEMSIMISRALDSTKTDYDKGDGILTIVDKASVDSWAVAGVDFAFENGFIKGDGTNFKPLDFTPVDQAVVIVNRVFEKYSNKIIAGDYKKDYSVSIENGNGYITYSNGVKKQVRSDVIYIDYLRSDNKNLYVLTKDKNSYRYDVSDMSYNEMPLSTYTLDMRVVQGGEYDGYVVVKTLIEGVTEYRVLENNSYNSYSGMVINSFSDLTEQIDDFNSKGFSYTVADQTYDTFEFVYGDDQKSEFNHESTSFIKLIRNSGQDEPFILATDANHDRMKFNGLGGTYNVEISMDSDGEFDGGFLFNVTKMDDLNSFCGYKATLKSNGDGTATAKLIKQDWSTGDVIVENKEVKIDTALYAHNKLRLFKDVNKLYFYVNNVLAFYVEGDFDNEDGYYGLLCEDGSTTFNSYKVEKLPY